MDIEVTCFTMGTLFLLRRRLIWERTRQGWYVDLAKARNFALFFVLQEMEDSICSGRQMRCRLS